MTPDDRDARIALLIDADNSPAGKIDVILAELAKFGVANIRRAYGNWKKQELRGWEEVLHEYAIRPMQQFDYSKGKNATDMSMVIDALDLLYTDRPDAFGIVSSDADFTPLVMHLKAKGALVYGFGAKKTPMSFVNACSRFLFLESIGRLPEAESEGAAADGKTVGCEDAPAAQARRGARGRGGERARRRPADECAEAGRAAREPGAQRRRGDGRRRWLERARRGRQADYQPGSVRPAQLRLQEARRPDRSDAALRLRSPRHDGDGARQARGTDVNEPTPEAPSALPLRGRHWRTGEAGSAVSGRSAN